MVLEPSWSALHLLFITALVLLTLVVLAVLFCV
jgi:hypothetical protein